VDKQFKRVKTQISISYTVESSIFVLCVDLFDIVDDVVIQRLAKQFVLAAQQSETKLEQCRCRNETFTT